MLKDITNFFDTKPGILKRAVVCNAKIVAWTTRPFAEVAALWRSESDKPLRLVPLAPLEGGKTQETWNRIWDKSAIITPKIREVRLKS